MDFRLHFPSTVEDAVAIKKATGGSYLAGGTILMVDRYHGKPVAKDMVSLERIDALHAIKETADTIEIGAACSFTQIEEFPPVKEYLWALYLSATEIGGPQVRNRGTIGGNWCSRSPASDAVAPILVLNPEVRMVEDLVVSFVFRKDQALRSAFRKVGKRTSLAVSILSIAVSFTEENGKRRVRVAVGSAAPTVRFCKETSRVLSESGDIEAAKDVLMTEISPIDDRWGSAEYRRVVARGLLDELYKEVTE